MRPLSQTNRSVAESFRHWLYPASAASFQESGCVPGTGLPVDLCPAKSFPALLAAEQGSVLAPLRSRAGLPWGGQRHAATGQMLQCFAGAVRTGHCAQCCDASGFKGCEPLEALAVLMSCCAYCRANEQWCVNKPFINALLSYGKVAVAKSLAY